MLIAGKGLRKGNRLKRTLLAVNGAFGRKDRPAGGKKTENDIKLVDAICFSSDEKEVNTYEKENAVPGYPGCFLVGHHM